ncbi:uncharacterized protein LOC122510123 isoform X2 [Leptopilina heterotoma]|uniref:uncharacterized protein LOC122510123 isoform X2 n=1 Tax=Leptopilina heterotoma TaxID=63436 RepID=UPI001CA93D9C|nr:uncharacterized protein LOC122510123 isoform X2 [Leptopilina heterotoma]
MPCQGAKIRNKERNAVQNKVNDEINKLNSISTMISAHTTSKEKGKSRRKNEKDHGNRKKKSTFQTDENISAGKDENSAQVPKPRVSKGGKPESKKKEAEFDNQEQREIASSQSDNSENEDSETEIVIEGTEVLESKIAEGHDSNKNGREINVNSGNKIANLRGKKGVEILQPSTSKGESMNFDIENNQNRQSPSEGAVAIVDSCFPTVTQEIVQFLKSLASYAEGKLGINTSTSAIENQPPNIESKKVQIINDEIVISKTNEIEFTRFQKRPEEMVRRLMLELVGKEELKTMTALGHSRVGKPGKAIPEKVRNAVYNYVKTKSKGIIYEKYIDTLNSQCCTLRNPRKRIYIPVDK